MAERVMLACSGGPDSIFLLTRFKHLKPLVIHVNYNLRATSKLDQRLVEDYCQREGLRLVVREVGEGEFKGGNLQAWARSLRYDLALEVGRREGIGRLLVAHHKDDYLETALMQRGRRGSAVGIPETNLWRGEIEVVRPLLFSYWKGEIKAILDREGVVYATDLTNLDPAYTRARVRLRLMGWSRARKGAYLTYFRLRGYLKRRVMRGSMATFKAWEEGGFRLDYLRGLGRREQERQVYILISRRYGGVVSLSSGKVSGIIDYLNAVGGGRLYKLTDHLALKKEAGRLVVVAYPPRET